MPLEHAVALVDAHMIYVWLRNLSEAARTWSCILNSHDLQSHVTCVHVFGASKTAESIWINVYCLWYYLDLPSMLMPVSCEIWGMNKWTWWDDNSTPRIILPFRQAECPKQISWLGGLVHKSHRLVHQQFWIDDKSFFDEWGPGVCEISSNLQPKLNATLTLSPDTALSREIIQT